MMRLFSLSLILAFTAACSSPPTPQQPSPIRATGIAGPSLAAHNRERAALGSPPLAWDPALAAAASGYAGQLARLGRLQHSPRAARPGQGENLWIGTRGAYSLDAMVGTWAAEKRHFRPGRFPATSRTGYWADTGHFTQMVWPTNSRLGCGIASSAQWDVLVCRYSPPGNVDGVRIGRAAAGRQAAT